MNKKVVLLLSLFAISSCTHYQKVPLGYTNYEVKGALVSSEICHKSLFPFSAFNYFSDTDLGIQKVQEQGKLTNVKAAYVETKQTHLWFFVYTKKCTIVDGE